MGDSLASQDYIAISQVGDTTDMVHTIDEATHLTRGEWVGRGEHIRTLAIVRSQLSSIRLARLIRATGTSQSRTDGGFG